MPPIAYFIIGIVLIIIATISAYNKLENQKEELEKKLNPRLDIEILQVTPYYSSKLKFPIPGVFWVVMISITNPSLIYDIGIKRIWIEKIGDLKGPKKIEHVKTAVYEEFKDKLKFAGGVLDHNLIVPKNKTMPGNLLFADICGAEGEYDYGILYKKFNFTLFLENSTGCIYREDWRPKV